MYKTALLATTLLFVSIGSATRSPAASTERERSYHSEHSIREILILLGAGAIDEALHLDIKQNFTLQQFAELRKKVDRDFEFHEERLIKKLTQAHREHSLTIKDFKIDQVELYVDEQRQELRLPGARRALHKIIDFLQDTDQTGSVRLTYRIQFRNVLVLRETFIQDGHVRLTTSVFGPLGPLTSATLITDAMESKHSGGQPSHKTTCIRNSIAACAPIGRCPRGPVTRIVERVMARRIDDLLCCLETEAVELARSGQNSLLGLSTRFIEEIHDGLR